MLQMENKNNYEALCPICAHNASKTIEFKDSSLGVTRILQCTHCNTKWAMRYIIDAKNLISYGEIPDTEDYSNDTVETVVDEMLYWANQEAFIRFDEYPRITCDAINETIEKFARRILLANSKNQQI